uniref:UPAR/Ly6 domain-containing protein n=1 Tax=Neogobius melanostomus TaxID=47308 RepID=A0A8C6SA17_9GOBI
MAKTVQKSPGESTKTKLEYVVLFPGDSIKCYSCQDYSGSCSKTEVCPLDDACLTLKARGGDTYRSCVRYSKCDFNILSWAFPTLSSFSYSCCPAHCCTNAEALTAVVWTRNKILKFHRSNET